MALCLAIALLPLPQARGDTHADNPAEHLGLTASLRDSFLNAAEKQLKSEAKVSTTFWDWLNQHPQIRSGLLTSAVPVPAVYAENLDRLRIALGKANADRYAQLILGVSLTRQMEPATPRNADGSYIASAYGSTPPSTSPAVEMVADHLKKARMSLADFVPQMDKILNDLHIPAPAKRDRSAFIDEVAYATNTYPPRTLLPLVDCLKNLIAHHETPLPVFKDKGPQWPLFPLDKAPWPLLAPLRQTLPKSELVFIWNRFNGKIAGATSRLATYGKYTFDYTKPSIQYKQSVWNPNALPRIIEDGGVCGRLSTLSQLSQVALGRPAVGMYQPGHRALLVYQHNDKTGHYKAVLEQGITSPFRSTNQWFLPPPNGMRVREKGTVVGVEYHVALTLAMNFDQTRYTNSRIAYFLALKPTASRQGKIALLQSAVRLNPYNLEAWYALSDMNGADAAAANEVLARMDELMLSPNSGLARERAMQGDADWASLANHPLPKDLRGDANLVASVVGREIITSVYESALRDKRNAKANQANLKDEIARREKLHLLKSDDLAPLLKKYKDLVQSPSDRPTTSPTSRRTQLQPFPFFFVPQIATSMPRASAKAALASIALSASAALLA